jgi:hypothetical protein
MSFNNYFTICNPRNNSSLTDTYNCCILQCDNQPEIVHNSRNNCYAMCNEIYPPKFIPKTICAFKNGCLNNMFYPPCLEEKKQEIQECCVQECKKNIGHQYMGSFFPLPYSLTNTEYSRLPYDFDCVEYCKQFKIIN